MCETHTQVANGLCSGCDVAGTDCSKCPFNADSVGDDMGFEDRSDAKGGSPNQEIFMFCHCDVL